MIDDARRCHAKSKQSGERCKRPAALGKRVCYMHGARGGGVKGNLNAMIHGIYAKRILNGEEQEVYNAFVEGLRRDFELNGSSDEVSTQMAAMAFVQHLRAVRAGDAKAADLFDGMVLRHLKTLKATKIVREGEAPGITTTPADWATQLLEDVKAAGKAARRSKEQPKADDKEATDAG